MPPFYPDSDSEPEDEDKFDPAPPVRPRLPQTSPAMEHSYSLLQNLLSSGRTLETVLEVLELMRAKGITPAVLISVICWHPDFPELMKDPRIQWHRTALTHMVDLKDWLHRLYKPPRQHNAGISMEGAHDVLMDFAMDIISREINTEMKALDPIMRSRQGEISEQKLLAIHLDKMISNVSSAAPKTWALLRKASYTREQEKKNKIKVPEPVGK